MTNTQRNALTAVGVVAGAGLLWFLFESIRADEAGIRVKNGSIYLETTTSGGQPGAGFERNGSGFWTKNKTKGCYTITVTGGSCDADLRTLKNAKKVSFTASDDQAQEGEDHDKWLGLAGKRFNVTNATGWDLTDLKKPTYGAATDYLKSVEASVGSTRLSCRATAKGMEAEFIPAVCTP